MNVRGAQDWKKIVLFIRIRGRNPATLISGLSSASQLHEMERDLDGETRRRSELDKAMRKQDRRLKEVLLNSEEDRKNQDRLQEGIDKLQIKCKNFKRQIEEAVSQTVAISGRETMDMSWIIVIPTQPSSFCTLPAY